MGKIVKGVAKRAITASEVSIPRSVGSYGNGKIGNIAARRASEKKGVRATAAILATPPAALGTFYAVNKDSKKQASDTTATKKKMGGAFDKYKSKKKK